MTAIGWLQIALTFALVLICVKPLGLFMARVFSNKGTFLTPVLAPVERGVYRLAGIDPT
jgi:K+-transporting ATPase ATPase A chain